jgi:hypothetical protein
MVTLREFISIQSNLPNLMELFLSLPFAEKFQTLLAGSLTLGMSALNLLPFGYCFSSPRNGSL